MSDLHMLAAVRDVTGRAPKLHPFETVEDVLITETRVVLKIGTAKITELKHSTRITQRGTVLYGWNLVEGQWIPQEPFALWWSTDERFESAWR